MYVVFSRIKWLTKEVEISIVAGLSRLSKDAVKLAYENNENGVVHSEAELEESAKAVFKKRTEEGEYGGGSERRR